MDRTVYIKIMLFNLLVGLLIFFMIEVFFGQTVVLITQNMNENSYFVVLIVIAGLLISSLIGYLSIYTLESYFKPKYIVIACSITFLINFFLWYIIALISTLNILESLSFFDRLIRFGKVFTIYSLTLRSPTLLWIYSQITFSIIFSLIIYLTKVPIRRKPKSKLKSRWI